MRIIRAAAAVAILTGLVAVTPSAGAVVPPDSFSISPKSPITGSTVITVSDDTSICFGTIHVTVGGGPAPETGTQAQTDLGDGGWSAAIPLPNTGGTYDVSAQCVQTNVSSATPIYTSESIEIIESPVLDLDPFTGPAGTSIDVSGTACQFTGVSVSLVLDPSGAATVLDSVTLSPETTTWFSTLHVPADAVATADGATYEVQAQCGTSVEFSFDYDPVRFTVTAADVTTTTVGTTSTTAPAAVQATPVSAADAFTG